MTRSSTFLALLRGARSGGRRAPSPAPVVTSALLAISLGACVSGGSPASSVCAADAVGVRLELERDALTPNDPQACRGQAVTLIVAANEDGVFHIHGYDDAVPATEVAAGADTTLEFEAVRAGQFPIEFHPLDDPRGVELGIFTVHEP
jgi:hypothetical protein